MTAGDGWSGMWASADAHHERLLSLYRAKAEAVEFTERVRLDESYRSELREMFNDASHAAIAFMRRMRGRAVTPPRHLPVEKAGADGGADKRAPRGTIYVPRDLPSGVCEDLGQELMAKAWKDCEKYNPGRSAPSRWLQRRGKTLLWNHLRRDSRERLFGDDKLPSVPNFASRTGLGLSGPRKLEIMQEVAHLLEAAALKPKERKLLAMAREAKSMEELYQQMMTRLGINYAAARRRVHRLARKLEACKAIIERDERRDPTIGDADDDE